MSKVTRIKAIEDTMFVNVESDAILYATFSPANDKYTSYMTIQFRSGGYYMYRDVDVRHFMLLVMSPSVGKAYHEFIRPNYSGTRVD